MSESQIIQWRKIIEWIEYTNRVTRAKKLNDKLWKKLNENTRQN